MGYGEFAAQLWVLSEKFASITHPQHSRHPQGRACTLKTYLISESLLTLGTRTALSYRRRILPVRFLSDFGLLKITSPLSLGALQNASAATI
jgi:hypothetical protein